jgi:hypothetical protein
MLISSIPSGNIAGVAAATSSASFQNLFSALIIPFLALTLLLGLLIPIFHVKRWLLNHPREALERRFSLSHNRREAHMRSGLYALERRIFNTLQVKEPNELQLDLLIYILYVCPVSLFVIAQYISAWRDPLFGTASAIIEKTGMGFWILRGRYALNVSQLLDFLLFLVFIGGLAYIAFTGLSVRRRYRFAVLVIIAGLIAAEALLTPTVYGAMHPDILLDPDCLRCVMPVFVPFILGVLGLSTLYCSVRGLLLRAYDTRAGATRHEWKTIGPHAGGGQSTTDMNVQREPQRGDLSP